MMVSSIYELFCVLNRWMVVKFIISVRVMCRL